MIACKLAGYMVLNAVLRSLTLLILFEEDGTPRVMNETPHGADFSFFKWTWLHALLQDGFVAIMLP